MRWRWSVMAFGRVMSYLSRQCPSSLRFSKRWQIFQTGQINWLWYLAHLFLKPIRTCLPSWTERGRSFKCVCFCFFLIWPLMWRGPVRGEKRGGGILDELAVLLMKHWAIIKAASYWSPLSCEVGQPDTGFLSHFFSSGSLWGPGTMKTHVRMSTLICCGFAPRFWAAQGGEIWLCVFVL